MLSFQLEVPILAEGERKTIQSMVEETPELSQQFLTINIEEPSLSTTHRILELWSEEQQKQGRLKFSPDSLEEALYLSHRFLARDRLPRKALDLLSQAGSLTEEGQSITGANVIERFCSHHRVPNLLIDPALPLELQDVDESVLDWITVHGYDPDYGARFLRRMIERHVTTAISDTIVRENPAPRDTIELSVRRNRIRARLHRKTPTSSTKPRKTVVLPVGTTKKIRNLDLNQLIAEARALVDAVSDRLAGLESDQREASNLLAQINEPDFWNRVDRRKVVLDRYRALDVAIRMRKR